MSRLPTATPAIISFQYVESIKKLTLSKICKRECDYTDANDRWLMRKAEKTSEKSVVLLECRTETLWDGRVREGSCAQLATVSSPRC